MQRFFLFLLLFLLLIAFRIPFIAVGHIQEDAFISWRCAVNLATTGTYGFNPGERVSASTTHLYVGLSAILCHFGKSQLPIIMQVVNSVFMVAAIFLFSEALGLTGSLLVWLWCLSALTPVALLASYSGMETSLLMLFIGIAVWSARRKEALTLAALFVLPWVRPDAVVFALLIAILGGPASRKDMAYRIVVSFAGLTSVLVWNLLYFGAPLNQTIVAKLVAYHPARSVPAVLMRVVSLFVGRDAFLGPIHTRYLSFLTPVAASVLLVLVVLAVLDSVRRSYAVREHLCLGLMAVLPPMAYAVGGVVFPWYLWPSAILGWLLGIAWAIRWTEGKRASVRRMTAVLGVAFFAALSAAQLVLSANWGCQERHYRGGIGAALAEVSNPGDTLLLEPAGYIPYYSGLYTFDEVGLASPIVTSYRQRFGVAWWPRFLRDVHPTFLVERGHILQGRTFEGYSLQTEERRWLEENYALQRVFTYDPALYCPSGCLLGRILRFGSAESYYLYRFRGEQKSRNFEHGRLEGGPADRSQCVQ